MPPQGPSPALFFDTISAYQRTEALRAAVEPDLFSLCSPGPGSCAANSTLFRRPRNRRWCRIRVEWNEGMAIRHPAVSPLLFFCFVPRGAEPGSTSRRSSPSENHSARAREGKEARTP